MSLFAIADTHLSLNGDKPMDVFQGWENYINKLENNWNSIVNSNDFVIIPGDISWAISLNDTVEDFKFLNNLNGIKIISKGNHDFWWSTKKKITDFLNENNFDTIKVIQNESFDFDDFSICAVRGWNLDGEDLHDDKMIRREALRLQMSIDACKNSEKIVFFHYPPVTTSSMENDILNVLKANDIKQCYYGHIHGYSKRNAVEGNIDNIKSELISADRLNFVPKLIKKF